MRGAGRLLSILVNNIIFRSFKQGMSLKRMCLTKWNRLLLYYLFIHCRASIIYASTVVTKIEFLSRHLVYMVLYWLKETAWVACYIRASGVK